MGPKVHELLFDCFVVHRVIMGVLVLVEGPAEVIKVNLGDTNALKNALDEIVGKVSTKAHTAISPTYLCV